MGFVGWVVVFEGVEEFEEGFVVVFKEVVGVEDVFVEGVR